MDSDMAPPVEPDVAPYRWIQSDLAASIRELRDSRDALVARLSMAVAPALAWSTRYPGQATLKRDGMSWKFNTERRG